MDLYRFCWVDVLLFHKPARLVSADCDQRNIKAAAFGRRLAVSKALLGVDKVFAVIGVAAEVPVRGGFKHCPAAPQRLAAITQAARRPVLHRGKVELNAVDVYAVPPVQLFDVGDAKVSKPGFYPQ